MIKVLAAAVLMTVLAGCAAGVSTRGGTTFGVGVAPAPIIYSRPVYRRPWGWGGPRYYRRHRYGR